MVDQKYLDKAEVLIEALPYIRRFHDKIIVVKGVEKQERKKIKLLQVNSEKHYIFISTLRI